MSDLFKKKPILIVGVGNSIMMDDGLGVEVMNQLHEEYTDDKVDFFEGGTLGIDMLPWLSDREVIIFIDAIEANHKPGTIFRFEPNEVNYKNAIKTSVHQIGLIDSLNMTNFIGKAPRETILIGVQPNIIDWGLDLSAEVLASIPKVKKLVIDEIEKAKIEIENKILSEV